MSNTREELKQQRDEQEEAYDRYMAIISPAFDTGGGDVRWDVLAILGTLAASLNNDDSEAMATRCAEYSSEQRRLRALLED